MAAAVSLGFNVDWFDNQAGLVRSYILKFTPQDQHIEMVKTPLGHARAHPHTFSFRFFGVEAGVEAGPSRRVYPPTGHGRAVTRMHGWGGSGLCELRHGIPFIFGFKVGWCEDV